MILTRIYGADGSYYFAEITVERYGDLIRLKCPSEFDMTPREANHLINVLKGELAKCLFVDSEQYE